MKLETTIPSEVCQKYAFEFKTKIIGVEMKLQEFSSTTAVTGRVHFSCGMLAYVSISYESVLHLFLEIFIALRYDG